MSPSDPLSNFPPPVREAQARWLAAHDLAALDTVVLAIVAFHRAKRTAPSVADELPAHARLVEDLGYDSLAMAEVVFFIEDLYQIVIPNQDLHDLHTVADLRAYIRARIGTS